jgi:hypothetical protein
LFYLVGLPAFYELNPEQQRKLRNTLTTSGYGWSGAFNASGKYSQATHNEFDIQSRRVEFRIVTNSDKVIEELNQIKL